jgi:hypothetical protein
MNVDKYKYKKCANCGKLMYRINWEDYIYKSDYGRKYYCGYNCRQKELRRRGKIK